MNIVFPDGSMMFDKSPISMCTGYKAKSLIMQKGDFKQLYELAYHNPNQFNAVMLQLEGRFT